jgi:hypothetical protein
MTDPMDETQPHPRANDGPAVGSAEAAPRATPDPAPATPDPAPATPNPATATPDPAPGSAGASPLRADPDRPADSGWREPAWFPPDRRDHRERDRRPSAVAMAVGLAFIVVGLYYFLDRTLRIEMPRIQWGSLWPVVLIVIGVLVLLRSFQRKA